MSTLPIVKVTEPLAEYGWMWINASDLEGSGYSLHVDTKTVRPLTRTAELEALLESEGWRAIREIAQPLGIDKPSGGWDEAIPLIVRAEERIQLGALE